MNTLVDNIVVSSAAMLFGVILALWAVNYSCGNQDKYVRDFIYWNIISINCSPRQK